MRSPSQRQRSTPTSGKLLEPAAWAEVRRPLVHRESKRTRESRERMFPVDRKVARRCNQLLVIAVRARLHVRVNHQAGQIQSIQSGKPLHRQEPVRSFVDRNKTYT